MENGLGLACWCVCVYVQHHDMHAVVAVSHAAGCIGPTGWCHRACSHPQASGISLLTRRCHIMILCGQQDKAGKQKQGITAYLSKPGPRFCCALLRFVVLAARCKPPCSLRALASLSNTHLSVLQDGKVLLHLRCM